VFMRRLGIVIAIIVALLVIIVVAVPLVLDINRYHGLVQAQLEKALGRPVTFGQMHLSLAPPSVRMENVVIGEAPQFGAGPFATMQEIAAALKVGPLLHRDFQLQSLDLKQPKVQLIRTASGIWNFSTLGQAQGQKPQEGTKDGFVLSNLKISDGQITLVDQQKHFRGVYNNVDVSLKDYAPGKAFELAVAMRLPGPGAEKVELTGTAGPIDQQNMIKMPFNGSLNINQVSLGGVQKVLDVPALEGIQGSASGKLEVRNENGVLSSGGSVKLDNGVVRNVRIEYPITLDYSVTDQLERDLIQIQQARLHLGQTPLSMQGTVNAGATPALLDLHVTTSNASIEEAARLASAFGVAFNPGMKVSGSVDADVRAKGATSAPQLNGRLAAKDVRVSGGDLKQPVDVKGIELTLNPREIRSNPFAATSGGTTVNVQFALMNYSTPSAQVDATLRTGNASLTELLAMARAYGVSAVDGITGSGTMSVDVHASGPLKNTAALNFNGSGKLERASLKMPEWSQPLNIGNADLKFTQNGMTAQNLAASIAGTNAGGSATIRNFNAPQVQFAITADKVNVVQLQQALGTAQTQAQPRADLWWSLVPRAEAQARAKAGGPRAAAPQPGLLEKATGGGTVTIGTLQYDQLLLQNVKSNVTLDHGIIRLAPITAGLYGGQQAGSITLDTRTTPITISANTKLQQVDANQLLSSVSSLKQTLYGLLNASGNTSFRAASSADVARTLNGTLALDLNKGRLAHVDLLNQLAQIGKFTGGTGQAQPFTDIVRLTGNFDIVNGLAQTNNLKALIPGGSLAADGAINLASNALNMHLTAVLSKELSQKVGGSQVGGFMQTALANRNGELVIPVIVTGTFDSPRFAPDVQKIAQMKLQNLMPTLNNPGALGSILGGQGNKGQQSGGLGGILGAITGQQQQQPPAQNQGGVAAPQGQQQPPPQQQAQPPQQQQQPQNSFGQILNQVLQQRKNKQQQQQPPAQQPPPPPPPPPK
jgi:uncharacterized protein involved in outer membrane biogenesis